MNTVSGPYMEPCEMCGQEHPTTVYIYDDFSVVGVGNTRCVVCWAKLGENDGHAEQLVEGKSIGRICRPCVNAESSLKQRKANAIRESEQESKTS